MEWYDELSARPAVDWTILDEIPRNLPRRLKSLLLENGIKIATSLKIGGTVYFESPCVMSENSRVQGSYIGAYSYVGAGSNFRNVFVGRFCSIGRNVTLGAAEHPLNLISTHPFNFNPDSWFSVDPYFRSIARRSRVPSVPVKVSSDVWIGEGAFVRSGLCLRTGGVVAARAVVTRDVEAYSVVAGNPARAVRQRLAEDDARRLQQSRWWERDLSSVNAPYGEIGAFCDQVASLAETARINPRIVRVSKADESRFKVEISQSVT